MPVHFNSFIPDKDEQLRKDLFANIVTKYTEKPDEIFATSDKKKIHVTSYLKDINTGNREGKVVITLIVREDHIDIVDVDITLLNQNSIGLKFESKLKESSESNEYYQVFIPDDDRHFEIETVNRYTIEDKEIEGTQQEVYLSAFPFQLEVFENEQELNERFGFSKEIDIPGVGKKMLGLATDMMSTRAMLNNDEPCSFVIGKVGNIRNVELNIADIIVKFKVIDLETATGLMPVAVNEENFDLRKLEIGKLICMVADIKADLKK